MTTFNPLRCIFLFVGLGLGTLATAQTAGHQEALAQKILASWTKAIIDPAVAQQELAALIRDNASSPLTEPAAWYLNRCRGYAPDKRIGAELITSLLSAHPEMHGFTHRLLATTAAQDARARGELGQWKQLLPAARDLSHFLVLGPLGDFADDQHDVVFSPERRGIDLDRIEPGTYGPCRWRKLTKPWHQTHVNPTTNLRFYKGAWYALCQVKATTPCKAWLLIQTQGSFTAWVNGQKTLDRQSAEAIIPNRLTAPIDLHAGWNRILVKTTEANSPRFSLRLIDQQGRQIPGLSEEKGRQCHPLRPVETPHRLPFPDATALLSQTSTPWARLLGCILLMEQGLSSRGLALAAGATAKPTDQPDEWQLHYGMCQLNARHLPTDLRHNRGRAILEKLVGQKGPASTLSTIILAELLLGEDQGEKAVRKLRNLLADHTDLFPAVNLLDKAYRRLQWQVETDRLREKLITIAPKRILYILRRAARQAQRGDLPTAYETIKQAHRTEPGNSSIIRRARRAATTLGLHQEADTWLAKEKALSPNQPELLLEQAWIAECRGDLTRAKELLKELQEHQPEQPEWVEKFGDLLLKEGLVKEAYDQYRRALVMDPSQHNLRWRIANHENRDWGAELAAYRTDIAKVIKNFKMQDSYRESTSILVVDHMVTRVFPDGSWINEVHQLRRINDLQGVDEYGEMEPEGDIVALRVWHPDGRIGEPIDVEGSYEIPDLKPGCFIEELTRNTHSQPERSAWEVTDFWFSRFEEDFLWTRLIVLLPSKHRGTFRSGDRLPPPQIDTKGDTIIYTFDHHNMSRVRRENQMPSEMEALPWTLYGEDRPINEINRELRERFLLRIRGSEEVKQATEKVCSGLPDDQAKVLAIYNFAQDHVPNRSGSGNPTAILLKQAGERWYLIAAMLRAARIPMRYGLVHPNAPGTDEMWPPIFNNTTTFADWYSIPALQVFPRGSRPTWIVAGMPRYLPFGMVHEELSGAPVMILAKAGPTVSYLPSANRGSLAQYIATGTIRLLPNRQAAGLFTLLFPGATGWQIKDLLRRSTKDQKDRFISGQLVSPLFRGATLHSFSVENFDNPTAPFQVKLRLVYQNFLQEEGGKPAIPTGIFQIGLSQLAERPDRIWPFINRENEVLKWQITIDPGDHWEIRDFPRSRLIQGDFFTWSLRFNPVGRKLQVSRSLVLEPGRVEAEKYSRLISHCRMIDELEARKIILEKK